MTKLTRSLSGVALAAIALMAPGHAMAQTVSWWYEALTPEQQKLLDDKLVGGFAASHPGVTLELEYRGNAVENQQRLALMSGGGPDIINSNGPATALSTAKAGQLLALDDYAAKLGWDKRLIPMFLSLGKVDGVLYSIPKNYEAMGLFYNADIFAAKGWTAPKTVTEMETLADTMLAEGMTPFVAGNAGFRPANEQFFTVALNQLAGPAAIREALAGTRPWTDPVFVEAMTKFKAWYDKGYYGKDYFSTSTIDAFAGMVTGKTGEGLLRGGRRQCRLHLHSGGRGRALSAVPDRGGLGAVDQRQVSQPGCGSPGDRLHLQRRLLRRDRAAMAG